MTSSPATCGYCSEPYVDPRMLQCLHSFCSKCLKNLQQENGSGTSLKCPNCKKTTVLPKGGVEALQKDLRKIYETEVADIEKKMHSKEEIRCDQCVPSGPSVSFCIDCREFLCEPCSNHHKICHKTRNHKMQPGRETDPLTDVPHKPIKCCFHKDELPQTLL